MALRMGPYGDGRRELELGALQPAPHGIDLGPLATGLRRRVFHPDGRIRLCAQPLLDAMDRCAVGLNWRPYPKELRIGRRELRTNSSWMYNVPGLVAGRERCVLLVHPEDARRARVHDGEVAILESLESRVHAGEVRIRVTDEMRPGVVSLPHGWGHAPSARRQRVAGAHPGVSVNDWTDDQAVESVVGQSTLNGIPVRLQPREPRGAVTCQ